MKNNKRDLVIIGGGAGGLVVASVAAQLGLDVVLIEKEPQLGGDCLHYGCVPSKALLKASKVAKTLKQAGNYGYQVDASATDMHAINLSVKEAVSTIQVHDSHERFESLGCEIITGKARFINPQSIKVEEQEISAKHFVIATGSKAFIPEIAGLETVTYLTNEDMYHLDALPGHLVILGGGPVGVEMAQAYSRFGARVTLIEKAGRILPNMDADISNTLMKVFADENIEVRTSSVVNDIKQENNTVKLTLEDGSNITGNKLLVAIGRKAAIEELDLEQAGVKYDQRGISVNAKMQTSNKRIYACGDVTGLMPLTHVAEQQAGTIIANLVFKLPKKMDYRVVPSVVYTEPECAQVGASASDVYPGSDIEIVKFDYAELDRAVSDHSTEGFAKLVVRKGRIVGAHIIGQRAGDVIHELVLAIQKKMKLSEITSMVHAYPSYAQINRRAASQYYRDKLFSNRTKKLVGLLNRWFS